jgi:hypothetical protein
MQQPYSRGHWTSHAGISQDYGHLKVGRRYVVVRLFADFDHDDHHPGETWTFLGYSFLPYDDGLSLFVSLDGDREWQIRMQLSDAAQETITRNLPDYVALA